MYADNDYIEPQTNEHFYDIIETEDTHNFEPTLSNSNVPPYPIESFEEVDQPIENFENMIATSSPINPFSDEPLDTTNLDTLFSPFGITGNTSETSETSDTNNYPETEEELYILREIQTLEFVNKLRRILSGDQYSIIEQLLNKIINLIAEKKLGFDSETITDSYGVDTIIHLYDKTIYDQDKYDIIASFRERDQMIYP